MGLASAVPRAYISAMGFFSRFSPVVAYRDLRAFLASRERYEIGFLALAVAITGGVVFAFVRNSQVEAPYKREIIYVQQWKLGRTDGEIKAQQLIDQAAREKREAIERAERAKSQAEFQRLDQSLSNMGI